MSVIRNITVVFVALFSWQYYIHNYPRTKEQTRVAGYFHPSFRRVAETFRSNLLSGKERGASFSVYHNGQVLVDMWGGWSDQSVQRHWQENTLTLCLSATEGMTYIAMAKLVDMGVLDYKNEVYHYWPEFKSDDKKNITVEMLLSNQAGLGNLDEAISLHDYQNNWEKVERLLLSQKPDWSSGTAADYPSVTGGMYADALMRKVDPKHRNMSQFFKTEIAEPFGIEFYIGLPKEQFYRFSRVQQSSIWEMRFSYSKLISYLLHPLQSMITFMTDIHKPEMMNNPDLLAVGMPSYVGIGTARSLAQVYDHIANIGNVLGKQLLSAPVAKALQTPVTNSLPHFFVTENLFSQGLLIRKNKQGHDMVGFSDFGGTYAFADTNIGVGMAYITNYLGFHLQDDPREMSLRDAFYECFEKYKSQAKVRQQT